MEEIELESEQIDVEKIMKEIKEKIRKRKEIGAHYTRDIDIYSSSIDTYNASSDISYINGQSTIANYSYLIESHRGILGNLLVKGRHLVHEEVKRYVDPVFLMQSEWNATAARLIKKNEIRVSSIDDRMRRIGKQIISSDTIPKYKENSFGELTEEGLLGIIHPHTYLIDCIRAYATKSAGDGVPKILEIGIDDGAFSIYLSSLFDFEVYGIGSSVDAISHSIENNEKLRGSAKFMLFDSSDICAFKEKYFDIAFSRGTLEHYDNTSIIKLLSMQQSIAKYVIFSVKSIFSPISGHMHGNKGRIEEWDTILYNAGFNVLKLEYYPDNQYLLGIVGE